MRTLSSAFPFIIIFTVWLFGPTTFVLGNVLVDKNETSASENSTVKKPSAKQIHLALLLDTSNSMDGLINQAKSQLWNIVDELADATHEGEPTELYIALYEYGNDNLSVTSNYIRQISPFTQDLDEISNLLFALKTNGGSEFCGAVIGDALSRLQWTTGEAHLRMIFIAGNEPFDQGGVSYEKSCSTANHRDVQVNTIFCGNYQEGVDTHWLRGAELGGGKYMNIDMDQQTVYVSTPYDSKIDELNDALNETYVGYGANGMKRKQQQVSEDMNAQSYSRSNKVKRAISKSKHVYKNDSWDLVDAKRERNISIAAIPDDELPEEMRTMSTQEKEHYIKEKALKRKRLQIEIQALADLRGTYIKQVNDSLAINNELEEAILESVKLTAESKNFQFDK